MWPCSTSSYLNYFRLVLRSLLFVRKTKQKTNNKNISVKYEVSRKEKAAAFTGVGFFTILFQTYRKRLTNTTKIIHV